MANRKFQFTKEEWESVAYEIDLDRIGRNPDWAMLNKYAKKLGIYPGTLRNWLMRWVICGKRTEDMLIIGEQLDNDKCEDTREADGVRDLPDLKRCRRKTC